MKKKVMFISSKGGHFNELMQLESLFKKYNVTLVTEAPMNKKSFKQKYKKYNVHFLLRCSNYKIVNISCCDMFPRTKHVECICKLERN